jgi:hypothetical protein
MTSDKLARAWKLSVELRDHFLLVPFHLDTGPLDDESWQSPIVQLIFHVNRQNFVSFLACLETDHVIPAAQLARTLLEESVKWEWMMDEPATRVRALFGDFRRSVDVIRDECANLGVDPGPFVNPSPFGDTSTLGRYEKGTAFPSIADMIRAIEARGRATLTAAGLDDSTYSVQALYAQYRVLSQLTHTSLLGITTTVQPSDDGAIAVGQSLPVPWQALLVHTAAASAVNVASYTVKHLADTRNPGEFISWTSHARELVLAIADVAAPIHTLNASL